MSIRIASRLSGYPATTCRRRLRSPRHAAPTGNHRICIVVFTVVAHRQRCALVRPLLCHRQVPTHPRSHTVLRLFGRRGAGQTPTAMCCEPDLFAPRDKACSCCRCQPANSPDMRSGLPRPDQHARGWVVAREKGGDERRRDVRGLDARAFSCCRWCWCSFWFVVVDVVVIVCSMESRSAVDACAHAAMPLRAKVPELGYQKVPLRLQHATPTYCGSVCIAMTWSSVVACLLQRPASLTFASRWSFLRTCA